MLAAMVAVAFSLAASIARGEPLEVKLNYMPEGHSLTIRHDQIVRYFTLDEYLVLLKIDNRLKVADDKLKITDQIELKLHDEIKMWQDQLALTNQQRTIYEQRAQRCDFNWKTCEGELAGAQSWNWVAFGVGTGAGVVVATTVILVIVYGAR